MTDTDLDLPQPAPDEVGPDALMGAARAKPGHATELEAQLLDLVQPTRQEPGVLAYHVHRTRGDPDLFAFYEAWRSVGDLRRHLAQPHIQFFLSGRHQVLDGDLSMCWLRMSSPYPS